MYVKNLICDSLGPRLLTFQVINFRPSSFNALVPSYGPWDREETDVVVVWDFILFYTIKYFKYVHYEPCIG